MTKRFIVLAALAVAVGCTARPAQERGQPPANMRLTVIPLALEPPPVYALIGYRDRLDLTSQQVTTLDSLATAVRDENGALVDSLEARAIINNRQPGVLQVNPSERPILDRIRANNRGVIDRVAELLNPEQETAVCELYEQDIREANRRRPRQQIDPWSNRTRDTRADTAHIVRGFSVWPWCQTTQAARDSLRNR
ncbi:MAG: hypothetical protein KY464_07930 [Gemmatimonadetes bacterium]|nr:hypothetical protein [Gemmatimonadota bacterium]